MRMGLNVLIVVSDVVVVVDDIIGLHIQYFCPKLVEQTALQRFGEEVSFHLLGGTVSNFYFLALDTVSDKEVADVDVFCPLATGLSVVLKKNGALIVLIDGGWTNMVALCLDEVPSPQDSCHHIIDSN